MRRTAAGGNLSASGYVGPTILQQNDRSPHEKVIFGLLVLACLLGAPIYIMQQLWRRKQQREQFWQDRLAMLRAHQHQKNGYAFRATQPLPQRSFYGNKVKLRERREALPHGNTTEPTTSI